MAPSAGIHTARIQVITHKGEDGEESSEPSEDERLTTLLSTAREYARARAGQVATSPSAMRQVKGLFGLAPLAEGDDGPRTGLSGFVVKEVRGTAETFGRFVGRKSALRFLGEQLALSTKRRVRLVTVRGDHGVGKTRLMGAFISYLYLSHQFPPRDPLQSASERLETGGRRLACKANSCS